jgi:DNA-binding XRE family transcriptional regulator
MASKKYPTKGVRSGSKGGQPGKYHDGYTRTTILELLRKGMSKKSTAAIVGISAQTIMNWERLYPEFKEEIDKAVHEGRFVHVENINAHSKNDWKASAWMLARMAPEDWGDKSNLDVTTNGKDLATQVVVYLPSNNRESLTEESTETDIEPS